MDAEHVLALFRRNPTLAQTVADNFRGGRAWDESRHYLGEKHGQPTGDRWFRQSILDPTRFVASVDRLPTGRWSWWYEGKVEGQKLDTVASPEEGMALADRGLDGVGITRI